MSTMTYLRRKAAGRCPDCGAPTTPPYVICPTCREAARLTYAVLMHDDHIAQLQARFALTHAEAVALEARLRQARDLPRLPPRAVVEDTPGPLLACCGTWQAVTTLPHRCSACGRLYLILRRPPACGVSLAP
jgi:hypothetical protein